MQKANNNGQYSRCQFLGGWFYDFENPKHTQTCRGATTQYRPWRSRCASVKRRLLGKWPRELPHICELLLFCVCARGGKLRPNLETTSGEEKPCPDLSLRSGRNTPFFFGGFFDLAKFVRTNVCLHMQCTQNLL